MDNEVEIYQGDGQDIAINRAPEAVLAEASKAANALQDVINKKQDVVKMNGKVYLTFEDWQTLGKFYGLTVGAESTEFIQYGDVQGFEAVGIVKDSTDRRVSRAESMCLNDEPNWKSKPLFQLKSMAQTRACAKALRNVLGFVAVLAGYAGTPAEEMTGQEFTPPKDTNQQKDPASDKQKKMIWAILNDLGYQTDEDKKTCAGHMLDRPIVSFNELSKTDAKVLIDKLKAEQAN